MVKLVDVKVKIAGKEVTLKELAEGREIVSFDGVRLLSRRSNGFIDVGTVFDENLKDSLSMTQQSFKDECDPNKIMQKYADGAIPLIMNKQPIYGDFTSGEDFASTERRLAAFKTCFNMLPASTRNKFSNDASKCIDFAMDPQNEEEAIRLGILPVVEVEPGAPVVEPAEVVAPAPSPKATAPVV